MLFIILRFTFFIFSAHHQPIFVSFHSFTTYFWSLFDDSSPKKFTFWRGRCEVFALWKNRINFIALEMNVGKRRNNPTIRENAENAAKRRMDWDEWCAYCSFSSCTSWLKVLASRESRIMFDYRRWNIHSAKQETTVFQRSFLKCCFCSIHCIDDSAG